MVLFPIMKLAFIKKRFSFHGGAERYLQTLTEHLKKEGHEIHIFSNKWDDEKGLIFHKVNILPITSFFSAISFNMNLKNAIKKIKSDCIISFERTTHQDIYRAGDGCHAEWLDIRSRFEPFHKRISFKINPLHIALLNLEKELFLKTGLIIANSKMVKEQIIKHYAAPEERIKIIYNGVDLIRFNPANKNRWRNDVRKHLAISEDLRVMLFVGSGFERKGLKTFLKALSLLKDKTIKALVIGKGDVKKYKALSDNYNIKDKVIFLGIQREIEKFYAAADLFVLPTIYDPFSNATLEAMASGIPVITTKNNGVAELIENGQEGFAMDSLADAQELADKINLSLSNLDFMAKKARQKAEQFSIEKAVNEFIEVIKSH